MAQRFGGRFSPDGSNQPGPQGAPNARGWAGRRPRSGGRANLLFIAPLPLVVTAFFKEPVGLALDLVAFGILMAAAFMTREGLKAEAAYDARRIARRPALPRKILGSVLTGLGLAVAGWSGDGSVLNPLIFGVLGVVLHVLSFGLDPMSDKGAEGIDQFQSDRVARAVDEAEKHLAAMSDAILRAGDRSLERRVEKFQGTVKTMFRTIEDDPRDLTGARKYLSVYLLGAKDATVKFADLYARTRDEGARSDYESLLDDLEANFSAQTEKLLGDNRTDLDIEIEVLRDRLAREGVRPE
ncbi:5-bromo-4-chloroindolyl phosphate hydrolysis family protein [Psychromarinibacter halotolerans]|uniref:5-bromo-4-chloroindolyl phosphate hydrolysis family protein n=1 Tax=Psychromarinibacter halotolerans TaxID=1775175 RepID=A0ABV7H176_9RHOB|nr:5-bromo-4-chloroindolyl phosphate hydrolysis family protein [Psychromarinibacter halotolerans]MDF0598087.1 5-bromo-4-chloroindolyl phosphate hydrolysis family protein [Psychromarinibacter halotolerans]